MAPYRSYHRDSTWASDAVCHHLNAKDFTDLWRELAPGQTLIYWASRSLAADCADVLAGGRRPKPRLTPEQGRAHAVRSWAQRKAKAGEGYLTQAQHDDGTFDYRITRAHTVVPRRTWAEGGEG